MAAAVVVVVVAGVFFCDRGVVVVVAVGVVACWRRVGVGVDFLVGVCFTCDRLTMTASSWSGSSNSKMSTSVRDLLVFDLARARLGAATGVSAATFEGEGTED